MIRQLTRVQTKKKSSLNIQIDIVDKENEQLQYQYSIIPESTDVSNPGEIKKLLQSIMVRNIFKSNQYDKLLLKQGKYSFVLASLMKTETQQHYEPFHFRLFNSNY